jgi:glutathione S-transferase
MTMRLYGAKGAGSMAAHAALEEAGAEYEFILLDLSKGEQKAPAYLAINPNGRVPTLVDGETVVFEGAACLMHAIDRHPDCGLAPPPGTAARGSYYRWLVWMTNTLQESGGAWAHPENWAGGDEAARDAVKAAAVARLERHWDMAEAGLEGRPWLLGEAFGGADLFLFMLAYWSRRYPVRAQDRPNLLAHARRVLERPAVRRMMAAEGAEWGLAQP